MAERPAGRPASPRRDRAVRVAVRFRPVAREEQELPAPWRVQAGAPGHCSLGGAERTEWQFDHVFGADATTAEVYAGACRDVVEAAADGYNGTIFAYGQTASGKTYTMQGDGSLQGVIPTAVTELCSRSLHLKCSYLEVYNEEVFDLLQPGLKRVDLRDRCDGGLEVVGCVQEPVHGPHDLLDLVKLGQERRRVSATACNAQSSRSHALLRIHIEALEGAAVRHSQLSLVDLAGSEGLKQTQSTGLLRRQGANINRSLLTLGKVIEQLSDRQPHVAYRDSKLTRLLSASLGGNAKTCILLCVSPVNEPETKCSLEFAQRALRVRNKVVRNAAQAGCSEELLVGLQRKVADLEAENAELRAREAALEAEVQELRLAAQKHGPGPAEAAPGPATPKPRPNAYRLFVREHKGRHWSQARLSAEYKRHKVEALLAADRLEDGAKLEQLRGELRGLFEACADGDLQRLRHQLGAREMLFALFERLGLQQAGEVVGLAPEVVQRTIVWHLGKLGTRPAEIAEATGLELARVEGLLVHHLHLQRKTVDDIAEELGLSPQLVQRRRKEGPGSPRKRPQGDAPPAKRRR